MSVGDERVVYGHRRQEDRDAGTPYQRARGLCRGSLLAGRASEHILALLLALDDNLRHLGPRGGRARLSGGRKPPAAHPSHEFNTGDGFA